MQAVHIAKSLRVQINERFKSMREAFITLDPDRSGCIDTVRLSRQTMLVRLVRKQLAGNGFDIAGSFTYMPSWCGVLCCLLGAFSAPFCQQKEVQELLKGQNFNYREEDINLFVASYAHSKEGGFNYVEFCKMVEGQKPFSN